MGVQLNHVCWLLLTAYFKISISMLKGMFKWTNDDVFRIEGGWRMSRFGARSESRMGNNPPVVRLNIKNGSVKSNSSRTYNKNQTDRIFQNENDYKFYARSSVVDISMEDIIKIEESGETDLDVQLVYDDTANNWW